MNFSLVLLPVLDTVLYSNEVRQECTKQTTLNVDRIDEASVNKSWLLLLDDKNRMISTLTKQLENQKMQLNYYITKEINPSMIYDLSQSCRPLAFEESLPLNLAINKFCRQSGIKTELSSVHGRMVRMSCRMFRCLRDHEDVLRHVIRVLKDADARQQAFSSQQSQTVAHQFSDVISNPNNVQLFGNLLDATLNLARKLESFKICCDRVLIVEEERTAIVEQVYSLTSDQRTNYNYLLRIETEKAKLHNELRRISRERQEMSRRAAEMSAMENLVRDLQCELKASYLRDEESRVAGLLEKINSEARVLLEMTKEQKTRSKHKQAKSEVANVDKILFYVRTAFVGEGGRRFGEKELESREMGLHEIRQFEIIREEIDKIAKSFRQEAEKEIDAVREKCGLFRQNAAELQKNNAKLISENRALKKSIVELKLERKFNYERLKRERDAYKSQVEDLQAIREAYAQLVEKQPNNLEMERDFVKQIDERDQRILDLENKLTIVVKELAVNELELYEKNEHILLLNRFLHLVHSNTQCTYKSNENSPSTAVSTNVFVANKSVIALRLSTKSSATSLSQTLTSESDDTPIYSAMAPCKKRSVIADGTSSTEEGIERYGEEVSIDDEQRAKETIGGEVKVVVSDGGGCFVGIARGESM